MRSPPLIILILFVIDAALTLAHLVNDLLGRPRDGLTRLVDLGGEANLPAWFAAMQGLCAALLMATFARRRVTREDRASRLLWLAPVLLLLISCDEVAQLHERFGGHSDVLLPGGSRTNTIFPYTGIWMFVLGIPFAVFLAWLIARTHRYFAVAPGALARFIAGFALLLTGSLVMDGLSNAFDLFSMRYNLMILAEEMLEMIGMTMIVWACLSLGVASAPLRDSPELAALTESLTAPERDRLAAVGPRAALRAKNPRA